MKKVLVFLLSMLCVAGVVACLAVCKKAEHIHSFDERIASEKYLEKAATCTEKAIYHFSCKCGEKSARTFEDGIVLGHLFTEYISDNNATCTEDGTKTATCDRCGSATDTVTDTGSKLGHLFTEYISDDNATCTEDGTETATCDRCDSATDTVTDTGSKLGHLFTEYISDNNATCTEDGTKTATCDRCDSATDIVTDTGSKLGHLFTEYISDNNATCTENGTKTATCDRCGSATDTVTDKGSKLPHEYINDICVNCKTIKPSEGLKLKFMTDEEGDYYEISGIGTCTDTKIVSPTEYNDLPVKSIGASAFRDCKGITSVIIVDSIKNIGNNAFKNCTGLESITLPFVGASENSTGYEQVFGYIFGYTTSSSGTFVNGATYQYHDSSKTYGYYHYYIPSSLKEVKITGGTIKSFAFNNCSRFESITIPNSANFIGVRSFYSCRGLKNVEIPSSVGYIDNEAFAYCSGLTSIVIGNGVTAIGSSAFYNCGLASVKIPDNVGYIGDMSFKSCKGLKDMVIGCGVNFIGDAAFENCGLETIAVESKNNAYYSSNNCLIENKTKKLIAGCKNSYIPNEGSVISIGEKSFEYSGIPSVIIPYSVIYVSPYAFYNCGSLKIVIVGNSVVSIGERSFAFCEQLTEITIFASTISIGDWAFYDCIALTTINFKGTTEQWKAIGKGNGWCYNLPSDCIIKCTNGVLSIND